MPFEVSLDEDAAKEIVQRAMFELLTEESRNALVQNALNELTKQPPSPGYGQPKPPSPLQDSFNRALQRITNQVVSEYLEDDIIQEQMREQILGVLKTMIEDKGTYLYEQIGFAVGKKIQEVLEEKRTW